ncbi:MAG: agmatinase [Deltaproteobacteria bacterium]|nr:agmatinase [Deltaproteobacteria bacterium]
MQSFLSGIEIIALPYERTTSYLKGTRFAPDAVIEELSKLDPFDFSLGLNPFKDTIPIINRPFDGSLTDPLILQTIGATAVNEAFMADRFPISIGGEHTVTLGPVLAARNNGSVGVVQLDAHGDLRNSYEGSKYSHACVMRRIIEMGCPTMGVGIRAICSDEAQFISENNIKIVHAKTVIDNNNWYELLNDMPQNIYLTIDMDFFDSADVTALGTPVAAGPGWDAAVAFITHLFKTKKVIGADIVELMPTIGDAPSIRMAARLAGLLTHLALH